MSFSRGTEKLSELPEVTQLALERCDSLQWPTVSYDKTSCLDTQYVGGGHYPGLWDHRVLPVPDQLWGRQRTRVGIGFCSSLAGWPWATLCASVYSYVILQLLMD